MYLILSSPIKCKIKTVSAQTAAAQVYKIKAALPRIWWRTRVVSPELLALQGGKNVCTLPLTDPPHEETSGGFTSALKTTWLLVQTHTPWRVDSCFFGEAPRLGTVALKILKGAHGELAFHYPLLSFSRHLLQSTRRKDGASLVKILFTWNQRTERDWSLLLP